MSFDDWRSAALPTFEEIFGQEHKEEDDAQAATMEASGMAQPVGIVTHCRQGGIRRRLGQRCGCGDGAWQLVTKDIHWRRGRHRCECDDGVLGCFVLARPWHGPQRSARPFPTRSLLDAGGDSADFRQRGAGCQRNLARAIKYTEHRSKLASERSRVAAHHDGWRTTIASASE